MPAVTQRQGRRTSPSKMVKEEPDEMSKGVRKALPTKFPTHKGRTGERRRTSASKTYHFPGNSRHQSQMYQERGRSGTWSGGLETNFTRTNADWSGRCMTSAMGLRLPPGPPATAQPRPGAPVPWNSSTHVRNQAKKKEEMWRQRQCSLSNACLESIEHQPAQEGSGNNKF